MRKKITDIVFLFLVMSVFTYRTFWQICRNPTPDYTEINLGMIFIGLLWWWIVYLFLRVPCKHEKKTWVRNIYGDEINQENARSLWKCDECYTTIKSDVLAPTTENELPPKIKIDLGRTITHSIINNKSYRVDRIESTVSEMTFLKTKDGICIEKFLSNETITIPYNHVKDFAMILLEAYCYFSEEFSQKEMEIKIEITENNKVCTCSANNTNITPVESCPVHGK